MTVGRNCSWRYLPVDGETIVVSYLDLISTASVGFVLSIGDFCVRISLEWDKGRETINRREWVAEAPKAPMQLHSTGVIIFWRYNCGYKSFLTSGESVNDPFQNGA